MGSNTVFSNEPVIDHGDVLILSVKPQVVPQVLPELKNSKKLLLSIAMGIPLLLIEKVISFAINKKNILILLQSYKIFTK